MPFLFREIVFCECGRPALAGGGGECRTCYEDGLRRLWREEFRYGVSEAPQVPVKMIPQRLRVHFAPGMTADELEREDVRRERRDERIARQAGELVPTG
jgi:hypothetical protein